MAEKTIFEKLVDVIDSSKLDAYKFYVSRSKSAGTSLRKKMQTIRTMAKQVRDDVQVVKKTREKH